MSTAPKIEKRNERSEGEAVEGSPRDSPPTIHAVRSKDERCTIGLVETPVKVLINAPEGVGKKVSNEKLRVNEVAAILGESAYIVRNWLRDFRDWIPVEKAANGHNEFTPAAVEQMKRIRHLIRDRGFSTRQVEHTLATGKEDTGAIAAADDVAELKEMVRQLAAAQEQQNELSQAILSKLDERDRQLTQFLIERREEAKQLQPPPRSRWKFWNR